MRQFQPGQGRNKVSDRAATENMYVHRTAGFLASPIIAVHAAVDLHS